MKLLSGLLLCSLILGVSSQSLFSFIGEATQARGRGHVESLLQHERSQLYKCTKYFHVRGNYDTAQRGPGVVWAAKVISDAREDLQRLMGHGAKDLMADQAANEWGCSGNDPNHF